MGINTEELKKLTEDQRTTKFKELRSKSDRTPDETEEMEWLVKDYNDGVQKRIDKVIGETKAERAAREAAEKRATDAEEKLEALKEERDRDVKVSKAERMTIDVGGKKWYTDEGLTQMVEAQEMTDAQAYKHQRERDKFEAKEMAKDEIKQESRQQDFQRQAKEDAERVYSKYPQWEKNSDKHDPEDPLYKKASQIFIEHFCDLDPNGKIKNIRDPKAFSKSMKLAEEIMGKDLGNPDASDDLSVHRSSIPTRQETRDKDVPYSVEEEDGAWRMFRDQTNPKTRKPYTKEEAIAKGKEAKKRRLVPAGGAR